MSWIFTFAGRIIGQLKGILLEQRTRNRGMQALNKRHKEMLIKFYGAPRQIKTLRPEKRHFWFENKILIWYNKSVNGITKERTVNGVRKV